MVALNPPPVRSIAVGVAALLLAASCSDEADIAQLPAEVPEELVSTTRPLPPDINGPNALLVVIDDLGVDHAPCYAPDAVAAPTIESLCASGVVFDQAWAMPTGSATRATILTGRYGRRTGIGDSLQRSDVIISDSEFSLPRAMTAADLIHEKSHFGVWDLGGDPETPNLMGWDYFGGVLESGLLTYDGYSKYTQGVARNVDAYITTDQVDDAIDWIGHRDRVPWTMWLAFVAAHEPFHVPPKELHEFGDLVATEDLVESSPRLFYDAAIQALDTELGRLLDSLEPEVRDQTTVIIVGDNGSPPELYPTEVDEEGEELPKRARGTLYQGGVHVPLIVSGPGVAGAPRRSDALVHTADLYPTMLELVGTSVEEVVPSTVTLDAVSLTPLLDDTARGVRTRLYSEIFGETQSQRLAGSTLRDDRYKVILFENGVVEAYDLLGDPDEQFDLYLDETAEIRPRLDALVSELEPLIPFEIVVEEERGRS